MNMMRKRIETLEAEQLKNNLRIVGVDDDENETNEMTMDTFVREVFNKACPLTQFNEHEVEPIKRIGTFTNDKTRMILVRFTHFEAKRTILKARDVLRQSKVRVANDVTVY